MAVRTRALVASGGAVLMALVLTGCGGADVGDAPAEHKSFALNGKTLTIRAGHSSVELVPADVQKVEVTRRVDGWVMFGSGPEPRWDMEDDTLTLKVKCDALISDCVSEHRVKVPRGVRVVVEGDDGRITASGFDTPLSLTADNGRVTVRDSSGPLELKSDNGRITGERISAPSVSAQSDNGRVQLDFTSVPDRVDTVSDNGGIVVVLPGGGTKYAVDASADNGRVSVDVPRGEGSRHVVRARSGNGEIDVRSAN
ncbi:DUF4097 family beta strand repeat-containing protein [Streptomyces sp. NPDC015184]|uniref:DUF4097 family beta strand repeat-containing protein n=2 Tax=unclassified Streptomyces TaxID=2593676 RepID=UPI0036FB6F77